LIGKKIKWFRGFIMTGSFDDATKKLYWLEFMS
jgi:hypothetical protein